MIILNANVFTVDQNKPHAQAVAVSGNKILAIGTNQEMQNLITPSTTVINARGRLVLPGFNDAHLHFLGGGLSLLELDLAGCQSLTEIQRRLKKAAQETPGGTWITGRGWDHTLFNAGKWPTKEQLDAVAPGRPVFLRRIDGHVGWANSRALAIAGIRAETPNPPGGEIVRHHDTGEATGILLENAMGLIAGHIPAHTAAQKELALRKALKLAAQVGVTSIQDNSEEEALELFAVLLAKNELTVRVSEWLPFELAKQPDELARVCRKNKLYEKESYLRLGLLKGFLDGTLGSRTAYFFESYSDDPATAGMPQFSQPELDKLVQSADSLGMQIGLHAIGAKANRMALTAYEQASKRRPGGDRRHRIEHAQVLRLEDIPKLAALEVVASMQPTHCTSDLRWAEDRIGHERCRGAYAWKSLLEAGAVVAFGTDWPVEPLDPMRGIHSAVTRQNIATGEPAGGWFPKQRLTVAEAIRCYTMDSAYAEFQENVKGSITPGKLADMIILSKNILQIQAEEILSTQVDMTIFDGKIIYER